MGAGGPANTLEPMQRGCSLLFVMRFRSALWGTMLLKAVKAVGADVEIAGPAGICVVFGICTSALGQKALKDDVVVEGIAELCAVEDAPRRVLFRL